MPSSTTQKKRWFAGGLHARRNPYVLMLVLAMGSSSILFLFLLMMLVARKLTVGMPPLSLPRVFWVSTATLIASSISLFMARRHFMAERYRKHLNGSGIALALGLLFGVTQVVGWWQLYRSGYTLHDSSAAAFLYLLSGLHFLHLLLAMGLLFWAVLDSSRNHTYVDGYLQSLDPAKSTRLQLSSWFWHFTDALWIILFTVFYVLLAR